MRIRIENGMLCAEVETLGAEMRSLVKRSGEQELMWSGDPAYWGGVSPVLFPFIGKLKDKTYTYQGKEYTMGQHGFARDMEFEVSCREKDRVVLALRDTEQTRECYPFAFRFEVEYALRGAQVETLFRMRNMGGEKAWFSVGGHPGFACPPAGDKDAKSRTDCSIRLIGLRDRDSFENLAVGPDGLLTGETVRIPVQDGLLPVTEHLFDQDALLLREQGVTAIALCDSRGQEYVRVESDVPVWGIWSRELSDAAYICLETWFGLCDYTDFHGTLQEKAGIIGVEAGACWEGGYRIVVS